MSSRLREFLPHELLLTPLGAWEALRFFFPTDVVGIYPEDLSLEDRLFAQGLLLAALDGTRALGPQHEPSETIRVAAGWVRLRPVIARFVALAPPAWFAHPVPEGSDPARIDGTVSASVGIRHNAGWIAHVRGGPLL